MELKTYFAQDASGNIMPGATVTVYEAGTATLATGLQDEAGSPLANPFTADSSAKVAFYAPDGLYDITVAGNGRTVTIRAQFVSVDGASVLRTDLAATGGSHLVGYDGGTAQDVLDDAKPMANYTALRAYTGRATGVRITQAGLAGFFQRDDTDTTSADNGGTIIVDGAGRRWKRLMSGPVHAIWFTGAGGAIDIQKAIDSGSVILLPEGTITPTAAIDLKGRYVIIEGAGSTKTIVKAGAALTNLFDIDETSDVVVSPFTLKGMTIDGNNTTTTGVNIRFRHTFSLIDLVVQNCTTNVKEKDTWLGHHVNVRSQGGQTPWWLVGSNHNSAYYRCTATAFTGNGIKIESQGTALDGNSGLLFSACDVEFADGAGVYFDGTEATFEACYLGENIGGAVFDVRGGKLKVNDGILFLGHTSSTYGFLAAGGQTTVCGTKIAGQGALSLSGLVSGLGGKVKFIDVETGLPVGGGQFFNGDPLDYGPAARTFVTRCGKNYVNVPYNNTVTTSVSGNSKTFTVATTTGSPSILTANAPLVNRADWRDGERGYLVVVYSSNVPLVVKFEAGNFGGAPQRAFAGLPSTGGVIQTAVRVDFELDDAAYTQLSIYNDTAVVGTSFTIHDVFLADSSFLNSSVLGDINNLYKC